MGNPESNSSPELSRIFLANGLREVERERLKSMFSSLAYVGIEHSTKPETDATAESILRSIQNQGMHVITQVSHTPSRPTDTEQLESLTAQLERANADVAKLERVAQVAHRALSLACDGSSEEANRWYEIASEQYNRAHQ